MTSLLKRLTAWLCLAVVLLCAVAPARAFVVCIEEDGCISIELKAADAECGGCFGHDDAGEPGTLVTTSQQVEPCTCLDLAVPRLPDEQRTSSASIELLNGLAIAPPTREQVEHRAESHIAARAPPRCVPRVAASLAHVRSVVLRL